MSVCVRPSCVAVFSPAAMGSFSAASGGIRDASLPRNANASPACRPPPSPPLLPAAAAAARASSKSRWTRLSLTETARLFSPPPLHFFFFFFNYGRIRIPGKALSGSQHVLISPLLLRQTRRSQTPDARRPSARPRSFTSSTLPLSRRIFFFLFFLFFPFSFLFFFFFLAAGPLPLLAPRSLAGAHSSCSLSDSPRSDL